MSENEQQEFAKAKEAARSLLVKAIEFASNKREQQLAAAKIDPARLMAVAIGASSLAFAKDTGEFPLPLFNEVGTTGEVLEPFLLRLNSVERGAYTDPLMADIAANEESWWAETMKDQVAAVVLSDVLQRAAIEEVVVSTPEDYWAKIRGSAPEFSSGNREALLLVESEFDPRWLHDWRWGRFDPQSFAKPDDLVISQTGRKPSAGYLFHMNSIAVYRAPVGRNASLLLTSTIFRKLEFTKFGSGLPVEVDFVPDDANAARGTIAVKYARRALVGDLGVLRIRFT